MLPSWKVGLLTAVHILLLGIFFRQVHNYFQKFKEGGITIKSTLAYQDPIPIPSFTFCFMDVLNETNAVKTFYSSEYLLNETIQGLGHADSPFLDELYYYKE